MNSRQSEAQKAQLAAALNRRPATGEEEPDALTGTIAPRVKPVRVTVDMEPDLHKRIKVWAVESDDLKLAEVVRVLIEEMLDKPELAELVRRKVLTRKAR